MAIFYVAVSMRKSHHDYSELITTLDKAKAQSILESSWLLSFERDIGALTKGLLSLCAKGDGLFVVELASDTRWSITGIDGEASAWIAEHSVQRKRKRRRVTPKSIGRNDL